MAGEQQQLTPEQQDAQAILEAREGYDKSARGTQPPTESTPPAATPAPVAQAPEQPLADLDEPDELPGDPGARTDPVVTPPKPDPIAAVSEQLSALRTQVKELADAGGAAAEVRKLHGEIGNINRTLTQLQQASQASAAGTPTSEDELVAVMKQVDEVAEQFPEIAGPLVKALKALQAKSATPAPQATPPVATPAPASEPPAQTTEVPAVDIEKVRLNARQTMAIEAIDELHPDRHLIKETPEFKTWFAAKAPEYQQRVLTTWNPAVLAQCFTDFKNQQLTRKRKQDRLDQAAAPQGGGGAPVPTTISDEQAAWEGYNAKPRAI